LEGEDLAAAFAVGDAFVIPSRTETLGLVLLEAMAAGCPVVAARAGGIPDIVTDRVNGHLFDPHAPHALTEAVTRLLAEDTTALRQAAREEASRWSWEAATRQLQGFYDRLTAKALVGTR
jgi:glycosyltransferase involved in cell wall biosynthesis